MVVSEYILQNKKDIVRSNWSSWPLPSSELTRESLPVGCLVSPLKEYPDLLQVQDKQITCTRQSCRAVLDLYW